MRHDTLGAWFGAVVPLVLVAVLDVAAVAARHTGEGDAVQLADVEAAFAGIHTRGLQRTACANGLIPRPSYRAVPTNFLFGLRNHFQGIQPLPDPRYVALSGANRDRSDLFIVRVTDDGDAERGDCDGAVVATLAVEDGLGHAGGLSLLDSILAVPVHGGSPRMGKVVFFDVSAPESPRRLSVEIARPGRKASAVALTRLPNGRLLVAVLAQFDGLPLRLDFYLSRSAAFADGFAPEPVTWRSADVQARPGQDRTFNHFQAITLILQADGRLYLAGFHNNLGPQAILPGRDYADLYEVAFPDGAATSENPVLATPSVVKVANRRFTCTDGFCNLDAAAGVLVDPLTQSLSVYAAPGWLDGDTIKMTVFTPGAAAR